MQIQGEGAVAPALPAELERADAAAPAAPQGPGGFRRVLDALGGRIDAGEALMGRAVSGRMGDLDPAAMIAVQAGIYRYVEAVDLTAKLVDRAGTAVRTVLQSGH